MNTRHIINEILASNNDNVKKCPISRGNITSTDTIKMGPKHSNTIYTLLHAFNYGHFNFNTFYIDSHFTCIFGGLNYRHSEISYSLWKHHE